MNWTNLWIKLFGTTKFMGLDMGFWVSIAVVIVVVILIHLNQHWVLDEIRQKDEMDIDEFANS